MRPFDLQKALAGDPVVTRDGREVAEIFFSKKSNLKQPVLALVAGSHEFEHFDKDGRLFVNDTCCKDLFMAPKMVKRWINIYRDGRGFTYSGSHLYESKEAATAKKCAACSPLKTICVEIEE